MSYNFSPLSDEQLDLIGLVENGIYNFSVINSTKKTSKAGNPMAELNIEYWDKEGKSHTVFDYLVFSAVPLNIRKVKHFCDSVGLSEQYKKGELPEEMAGLSGHLEIGVQDAQPKVGGGFYAKKNVVVDYVLAEKDSSKSSNDSKGHADLPFSDDIPF